MKNKSGSYPTHKDTADNSLRNYNQLQSMRNLNKDVGFAAAQQYLNSLSKEDAAAVLTLLITVAQGAK